MLRKIIITVLLFGSSIALTNRFYAQEVEAVKTSVSKNKKKKFQQRVGINSAWLIQNAPFQEFSSYQLNSVWYAQGIHPWMMGKAGTGFAIGFSYDLTFVNGMMFRLQGQLESTGWIAGIIDIGTGIRTRIGRKVLFSLEFYLSIAQTGGKLSRIALPNDSTPDKISFYTGFFGFKTRMALEIPISKKFFISPYMSYAFYPWKASNLKAPFYVNGFSQGAILDSLQVGFEFGSKF